MSTAVTSTKPVHVYSQKANKFQAKEIKELSIDERTALGADESERAERPPNWCPLPLPHTHRPR